MEHAQAPTDDGEVLIIEVDGKATPTATAAALHKRRGKRHPKPHACGCARHRGQAKGACRGKKKRRQPGDKSNNGRSITLVVMYTLKRSEDGRLHGPINKRVWGSYASRKVMVAWARRQATKRGFPPDTDKRIHIVVDGETGWLVPADGFESLAATLEAFCSDAERRRRFGCAGQAHARREFSSRLMIQRMEALYNEVLDRGATA